MEVLVRMRGIAVVVHSVRSEALAGYGRLCTAAKYYREWAQEDFCYDSNIGISQNEAYTYQLSACM